MRRWIWLRLNGRPRICPTDGESFESWCGRSHLCAHGTLSETQRLPSSGCISRVRSLELASSSLSNPGQLSWRRAIQVRYCHGSVRRRVRSKRGVARSSNASEPLGSLPTGAEQVIGWPPPATVNRARSPALRAFSDRDSHLLRPGSCAFGAALRNARLMSSTRT